MILVAIKKQQESYSFKEMNDINHVTILGEYVLSEEDPDIDDVVDEAPDIDESEEDVS